MTTREPRGDAGYRLTIHLARSPRPLDQARPRVDILVLNFNGREHVRECLDSLRELTYPAAHTVVIDQGSTDGSQQLVLQQYPEVTLLALDRNLDFCRANNLAIDWALEQGARYVFVLNNDTTVAPDCVDKLVETAEAHPEYGIVSPRNDHYHDPAVTDLGVRVTWWRGFLYTLRPKDVPPGTNLLVVDYAAGCSLLIKREVLAKIHGFDPNWNIFHEDADLCLRARREGYLTVTRLDASIRHKFGMSMTTYRRYFRHWYLRQRNLFRLVMRHAPLRAKIAFVPLFPLYVLPRQALIAVLGLPRVARAAGRR